MNHQLHNIISLLTKIVSIILIMGTIFGTVLMGSNLYLIINVPSFIIVAIVTLCGILFSFGPIFPFKALAGAFVIFDHFTKKDFNLSVKLLNHASYLSFVAGLISTLISFMQIFTVATNWQLVDTRTVTALLPFFYGVIGSILVFQSLKFSLIHNYVNKFTRQQIKD